MITLGYHGSVSTSKVHCFEARVAWVADDESCSFGDVVASSFTHSACTVMLVA